MDVRDGTAHFMVEFPEGLLGGIAWVGRTAVLGTRGVCLVFLKRRNDNLFLGSWSWCQNSIWICKSSETRD